jgi:hypothetical protein
MLQNAIPQCVIHDVATALKVPITIEGIYVDVPEALEKPVATEVDFIADRIRALVNAERLESARNLDRRRYSEIRLTGK